MSRSAERAERAERGGRARPARWRVLAVWALTLPVALAAGAAVAQQPTPSPSPPPATAPPTLTVPPSAGPAGAAGAPLDIVAPVLDIVAPESSLDESISRAQIGNQERFTLAADVLFAFDKADLTPAARSRLREVTDALRRKTTGEVRIDGYTDAKGSPAYNLGLSLRRARAVQAALQAALPGSPLRFVARGHGEADPVAANTRPDGSDNPKGRAKNRRVTITFPR
jgi:outer membrane protein OmpA-like peptidoglycan-associated protein